MPDRYWVGGNDNWNATAGTKWATTSGGTGGEAVPTSSDAVFLDNGTGTGNVTVSASSVCASLNCTGYVGTLTVNSALTVSGAITLAAGMSSAGSSVLIGNTTATWTANGHQWGARLSARGTSQTYTLADAWVITAAFDAAGDPVLNGSTLSCAGLTMSGSAFSGSTVVTLTGGTWSGAYNVGTSLTFAGNVTVSGAVSYSTGTLTYTSGTITTTGSTLTLGPNTTLNTNGVTWATVRTSGTSTYTVNSLLSATTLDVRGDTTPIFVGTAGFTVGTVTNGTALDSSRTVSLLYTNTYTVTTGITLAGTGSYHWTLASSHGSNRVPFVFSGGTSPSLNLVKATRLDSSGGTKIYTNDTITDSLNWEAPVTGGYMWLF